MFIIRASGSHSTLSIRTDSPSKALEASREFVERGMADVGVTSDSGEPLTMEQLEAMVEQRIAEAA